MNTTRAIAISVLAASAHADLPRTADFHITAEGSPPPAAGIVLRCLEGDHPSTPFGQFRNIGPVLASTTRDFTPSPPLADGPWTCYVDVITAETPVRYLPTNRVTFTIDTTAEEPTPQPVFRFFLEVTAR